MPNISRRVWRLTQHRNCRSKRRVRQLVEADPQHFFRGTKFWSIQFVKHLEWHVVEWHCPSYSGLISRRKWRFAQLWTTILSFIVQQLVEARHEHFFLGTKFWSLQFVKHLKWHVVAYYCSSDSQLVSRRKWRFTQHWTAVMTFIVQQLVEARHKHFFRGAKSWSNKFDPLKAIMVMECQGSYYLCLIYQGEYGVWHSTETAVASVVFDNL